MKATTLYRRCADIILLLTPMDLDGGVFVRVGKDHDDGYVMLDALHPDVYMFDHTIKSLPTGLSRCHPFAIGVTGHLKGAALRTLTELLAEHGHAASRRLIMKMDIDGAEWDVSDAAGSDVIDQFSQIVVEYHGLTSAVYRPADMSEVVRVLTKLNRTHQCLHVHANGARLPIWVGPLVLPEILEVTYVRRADWADRPSVSRRQFPTEIDEPSSEGWPDVYLGKFSP